MASAIPSPYQLTDDCVNSVFRNTALPNSQITYTATDIIAFLNEEQQTTISALVQSIREKYWIQYHDVIINPNVASYIVPQRCIMGALEDIVLVDSSGNEIEIAQLADEQKKVAPFYSFVPIASMRGMYARDDTFNIYPITFPYPAGFIIRFKYARRPSVLVSSTFCGQIMSVNYVTNTVVLSNVPSGWVQGSTIVDVINNLPQFTSQSDDNLITGISGTSVTLTSLPSTVVSGQWLCPQGTTCVPQIPFELYPLLINSACLRVFVSMQNANGFNTMSKVVTAQIDDAKTLLTPRWKGQPKKVVNKNVAWPLSSLFPNFR
jgi:hypothetical protein